MVTLLFVLESLSHATDTLDLKPVFFLSFRLSNNNKAVPIIHQMVKHYFRGLFYSSLDQARLFLTAIYIDSCVLFQSVEVH